MKLSSIKPIDWLFIILAALAWLGVMAAASTRLMMHALSLASLFYMLLAIAWAWLRTRQPTQPAKRVNPNPFLDPFGE